MTTTICKTVLGILVSFALFDRLNGFLSENSLTHHCRHAKPSFITERQASASSAEDESSLQNKRKTLEFKNLEPLPEPEARRERIIRDKQLRKRFVKYGDELWDLREEMNHLSIKLLDAINEGQEITEEITRESLREAESKDPELVYMLELAEVEEATNDGRLDDAAIHRARALEARSCLPQFNLDGLWVGKYGSHGYELINVTYVGDTLFATKVTGDKNVPRGEVSFKINLHPLLYSKPGSKKTRLEPIKLSQEASRKWGTRQLPRYQGSGQVAEEGFVNSQWMEGQLIIIGDDYFSFAWVPLEHQIFFGRPSPELALKMLREDGDSPFRSNRSYDKPPASDACIDTLKDYATSCLEKSIECFEGVDGEGYNCIWVDSDSEECAFE